MNLQETVDLIQKTAQQAAGANGKVAVVSLPHEPEGVYGVIAADGSYERTTALPLPRNHYLGSVSQVAAFVQRAKTNLGGDPTVWLNSDGVIVVIHDADGSRREDTATVFFKRTAPFRWLWTEVKAATWLDQKSFIRLLRLDLADCLGESGEQILKTLRSVDFGAATSGKGIVEHGRESLGRELEAEMRSAAGDIPERLTLNVRLFEDPDLTFRHSVSCMLDLNPREGTFNLAPYADELRVALDDELMRIHERLNECDCPVFLGTP